MIEVSKEYIIEELNWQVKLMHVSNDYVFGMYFDEEINTWVPCAWNPDGTQPTNDLYNLCLKPKYADISIDQPLEYSCDGFFWVKGHFAGECRNGNVLVWKKGRTSWTSEGICPETVIEVPYCKIKGHYNVSN